jgi:hypothetical protein
MGSQTDVGATLARCLHNAKYALEHWPKVAFVGAPVRITLEELVADLNELRIRFRPDNYPSLKTGLKCNGYLGQNEAPESEESTC